MCTSVKKMTLKLEDIPCLNLGQFLLGHMKQHDKQKVGLVS